MQLGMIGLGRMGANMVRRLMRDGHECVVFDVDRGRPGSKLEGARAPASLADFVSQARAAARRVDDGPGRARRPDRRRARRRCSSPATSSSTAATRYYRDDIDRGERARAERASTTSTSARAAACSASSAATA